MASAEPITRMVKLPSGETKWVRTGKWRGVYRDADGKKQHTKAPHYGRKTDAKAAANAKEVEARRRAPREVGDVLPSIKWGAWWDLIKEGRAKEHKGDAALIEGYRVSSVVRPRWEEVELNRVTRKAVQAWVDEMAIKYKPSYVHNCYITFKVSMNKAVADGGPLDASPCVNIVLPSIQREPRPYVEADEIDKFTSRLPKGYDDATELGFETGLRPSELAGMHAKRVNLKTGWLRVQEVYVRRRKSIKPFPKNDKARDVALTPRAIAIIERNLADRQLAGGCGYPHDDGSKCDSVLILVNSKGSAVCPERLGKQMQSAAIKAGVEHKSPYALRHGNSTRLQEGDLDPWTHARQLGHATLEQTGNYNQVTPRTRGRILAALGEPTPLTVVDGGRQGGGPAGTGTDAGTYPDSQALSEVTRNA